MSEEKSGSSFRIREGTEGIMIRTLVLYDGKMSSAERIADKLSCLIGNARAVEITEAPEDITPYNGFCFVFNFYGAVTASRTRAWLMANRDYIADKRLAMVGIGFSDLGFTKYVVDTEEVAAVRGIAGIFVAAESETLRAGYEIGRIMREAWIPMPEEALREEIRRYIMDHHTMALATASRGYVRCTPVEYLYLDRVFYIITEGGNKFRGVLEDGLASAAIFGEYREGGPVDGLQIMGDILQVPVGSEEYMDIMRKKGLKQAALDELPVTLFLLRFTPCRYEYMNSALKEKHYDVTQVLETGLRQIKREAGVSYRTWQMLQGETGPAEETEETGPAEETEETGPAEEAEETGKAEETEVIRTAGTEEAQESGMPEETADSDAAGETLTAGTEEEIEFIIPEEEAYEEPEEEYSEEPYEEPDEMTGGVMEEASWQTMAALSEDGLDGIRAADEMTASLPESGISAARIMKGEIPTSQLPVLELPEEGEAPSGEETETAEESEKEERERIHTDAFGTIELPKIDMSVIEGLDRPAETEPQDMPAPVFDAFGDGEEWNADEAAREAGYRDADELAMENGFPPSSPSAPGVPEEKVPLKGAWNFAEEEEDGEYDDDLRSLLGLDGGAEEPHAVPEPEAEEDDISEEAFSLEEFESDEEEAPPRPVRRSENRTRNRRKKEKNTGIFGRIGQSITRILTIEDEEADDEPEPVPSRPDLKRRNEELPETYGDDPGGRIEAVTEETFESSRRRKKASSQERRASKKERVKTASRTSAAPRSGLFDEIDDEDEDDFTFFGMEE